MCGVCILDDGYVGTDFGGMLSRLHACPKALVQLPITLFTEMTSRAKMVY